MPGFLGVYNENANFLNCFDNCKRLDLINDKVFTESVYLERRTINKFLNDKLFLETEKFIIITEGVILNSKDLSEINSALEKIKVTGDRYPEELEKRTGL